MLDTDDCPGIFDDNQKLTHLLHKLDATLYHIAGIIDEAFILTN